MTKTIQIPEPIEYVPFDQKLRGRVAGTLTFQLFVAHILGNVTGTLELAQTMSRVKKALHEQQPGSSVDIETKDHDVLVEVCKQRQLHMADFEKLEPFFNVLTE